MEIEWRCREDGRKRRFRKGEIGKCIYIYIYRERGRMEM